MTRYARIEASRLARKGRDTTAPVRLPREPGDGVRLAKAAYAKSLPSFVPHLPRKSGNHATRSSERRAWKRGEG